MLVNLDTFEMSWLLDACLRGSHIRSGTVEKFVDQWYDKFTEQQRYDLYEWTLRLTYLCEKEFKPDSRCCGTDIAFMSRYDPMNQYIITTKYNGKEEKHRAFLYNDEYHTTSSRYIAKKYITCIVKFVPTVVRTEYEINFKGRRH